MEDFQNLNNLKQSVKLYQRRIPIVFVNINNNVIFYCIFSVLDATSKGPEGLITGNTFSFGNFDQCLGTSSKKVGISGGYTLVDIDFRPSDRVYPGYYDNDHSRDYEPQDEDASAWDVLKVILYLYKYC